MTTYYAQASGNISAIEWNTSRYGGGSVLVWTANHPDDIFIANGKNVTIDCDFTAHSLETTAGGGQFQVSIDCTINADILLVNHLVTVLRILSGNVTFNGDIYGSSGSYGIKGIDSSSSGTLTINGDVTGGSYYSNNAVYLIIGSLVVNGDVSAGLGGYTNGVYAANCTSVVINGDVTGGVSSESYGAYISACNDVTINGDITAGTFFNCHGFYGSSAGPIVNGDVNGGTFFNAYGMYLTGNSDGVTIYGNLNNGESNVNAPAVHNYMTTTTVHIYGIVYFRTNTVPVHSYSFNFHTQALFYLENEDGSFTICKGPPNIEDLAGEGMDIPPSLILLRYLQSIDALDEYDGTEWPTRLNAMPQEPDNCVSIYDTSGILDGRLMDGENIEHYGIQVRFRGNDYESTWNKINQINKVLEILTNYSLVINTKTYIIMNISKTSPVVNLGQETDGRRWLFTINYLMTIKS
jgi:hypothetical protein